MENNDEITLSEAKRVTAELKASILKLDALNQEVANNITQLQDLNLKLKDYSVILNKFNFKDENEMALSYGAYLSFLSTKLEQLSKNSNLKKLENTINLSTNIINFSIAKLAATITICVGAFYIVTKLN